MVASKIAGRLLGKHKMEGKVEGDKVRRRRGVEVSWSRTMVQRRRQMRLPREHEWCLDLNLARPRLLARSR